MADTKISALTAATTPLDGTEVLPIVQSSTTKKVANNDLRPKQIQSNATSGVLQIAGPAAATTRIMTTPNANFTVARTDAAQTFTGSQTVSDGSLTAGAVADVLIGRYDSTYPTSGAGYFKLKTVNNDGTTGGIIVQTLQAGAFRDSYKIEELGSGTSQHTWSSGGSTQFRLNTSGNLVPLNANKGIDFTANSAAAGMTSQLLNWYEEGTWTPTVTFGGGNTGITGTFAGKYTRIGRQVIGYCTLAFSNKGSSTGAMSVSGLPFTSGTVSTFSCPAGYVANLASAFQLQAWINETATSITMQKGNLASTANVTDADIQNNTRIDLSFTYLV